MGGWGWSGRDNNLGVGDGGTAVEMVVVIGNLGVKRMKFRVRLMMLAFWNS